MLSAITEVRSPHHLSRESRVSLPDEAKQYIANMIDSPVPSPKVDAFAPRATSATVIHSSPLANGGLAPPPTSMLRSDSESPAGTSEFLDMDSDMPEEDEDADDTGTVDRDEEFDSPIQQTPSSESQQAPFTSQRRSKPRAAPEDFPLPPSGAQLQAQQSITAGGSDVSHQHSMGSSPPSGYPSSEALNDPPTGTQPLQPLRLDTQRADGQAAFRALPLLSSDLPNTSINVSHSFVRPNDRGKEVLSFIIFVHPGNGKEGWKVEKMYSDVLGLDQRVRNSVGKGVGKRIGSLPEGKLWKDHAPAKVDQRKVR